MLPNLGRLSLQQADTRVIFTYDDTEKWDKAYKQKFQENECPVCFEKFKRGDEIVVLECGHVFCGECFRQWDQNKRNCPLCRKRVEDDELLTPEGLFLKAARDGNLAKVTQMLKDGFDVNAHDENGNTALMEACIQNHTDVALALLKHKDIKVDLVNNNGETALNYASANGMLAVVKKLIKKRANVNAQDGNTFTALMRACFRGHTDVALALLEDDNIRVDLENNKGETALHPASRQGMLAVIEKLIKKRADVNKQNKSDITALMWACDYKQADVALALLESKDIKVDLKDEDGDTALHWASSRGVLEVVKKLIEKDADVNKQNKSDITALILACYARNTDIALALLESKNIEVDLANLDGETALHPASRQGMLAVVEKLIQKRADANKQNRSGFAALMQACAYKHTHVALALLNVDGIEVNLVSVVGETALHYASKNGMTEVVKELIKKGANVNVRDEDGNTALMNACMYGHTDVALALLERTGIEVDLANNDGETALHQAFNNNMTEVVERIREIQSRRASDDAAPMEVDVVSPDDRRDKSGEGRSVRQRIRATAAGRLRVRLQKLV